MVEAVSSWISLFYFHEITHIHNIDGLIQERRNSIANALELCFSGTNPSIWLALTIDSS